LSNSKFIGYFYEISLSNRDIIFDPRDKRGRKKKEREEENVFLSERFLDMC